jgi:hypothetical protein
VKEVKRYIWEEDAGHQRFAVGGTPPKHYAFRLQRQVEAAEQAGDKFLTLHISELRRVADLAVLHFPRANKRPKPPADLVVAEGRAKLAKLRAKAKAKGRRPTTVEINEIIDPISAKTGWKANTVWGQLRRKKVRDRTKKKPALDEGGQV